MACLGGKSAPIDAYDMSQWKGYGPDNVVPSAADLPDDGPQSAASAGALTYEPYYGLKAKPFSLSTDPRSLYKSPASILRCSTTCSSVSAGARGSSC